MTSWRATHAVKGLYTKPSATPRPASPSADPPHGTPAATLPEAALLYFRTWLRPAAMKDGKSLVPMANQYHAIFVQVRHFVSSTAWSGS
jgi:hypothetical protein